MCVSIAKFYNMYMSLELFFFLFFLLVLLLLSICYFRKPLMAILTLRLRQFVDAVLLCCSEELVDHKPQKCIGQSHMN